MKRRKPIACLLSACRRQKCGTRAGPNSAAGSHGTARLRHPVPPLRDGVARDEQQAPGCEVLGGAPTAPVTELEAAGRTEAHRGDVPLAAVGVVAVTVPSHGVAAIAIEIREHPG